MAPNIDAKQITNLYGTNGFNTQGAINLAGSAIGGQSYGDIAWFSNAVQTMGNGTTEQKVQTGMNIVQKIVSAVIGAGIKEGAAAPVETAEHANKAKNVVEEQKNAQKKLQKDIEDINNKIEEQINQINAELEKIQETTEEASRKQEEVAAIQNQITAKQEELNTSDDKEGVLKEIQGLSDQLGTIITEIIALNNNVKEGNDKVDKVTKSIDTQTKNADNVAQQGQTDITNIKQQANLSDADASSDQQMSTQDKQAAIKLQAKAAAASSCTFGAGGAAYQADIIGFNSGSTIRNTGAIAVREFVKAGLGGLDTNLSMLTNFSNGIGNYTSEFTGCLGDYSTLADTLLGAITTIGSEMQTTEKIDESVENDLELLATNNNQNETNKSEENGDNSEENNDTNNVQLQTANIEIEEIETELA